MIRRTVQYPSGEQRWILISQIVHARVAATLADEWVEPFVGLEPANFTKNIKKGTELWTK